MVFGEAGIRVSVRSAQRQCLSGTEGNRCLEADTARTSGVGHGTSRGVAVRKYGELLVATRHPVSENLGAEAFVATLEPCSDFVGPIALGTVGEHGVDVIFGLHTHLLHHLLLEYVTEHLCVVSAGLVSACHRAKDAPATVRGVIDKYLRQQLVESLMQRALVVYRYRARLQRNLYPGRQ